MKCSVISCKSKVKFKFPSNEATKKKWLKAIGRTTFVPHTRDGLCNAHFNPNDIITESYRSGYKLQNVRLKSGAVPTQVAEKKIEEKLHVPQFILTEGDLLSPPSKFIQQLDSDVEAKPTEMVTEILDKDLCSTKSECNNDYSNTIDQSTMNQINASNCDEVDVCAYDDSNLDFKYNIYAYVEEFSSYVKQTDSDESSQTPHDNKQISHNNCNEKISKSSQTYSVPRYTITDFKDKPKSLLHLTGLENYDKFMLVLYSLGPGVYHLKYVQKHTGNLDVPNQLFLVLWKLRRYTSDLELAEHFNVPECAVGNIFVTWILFMSKTWSLLDIWPSRELIDFYMPDIFKKYNPTTRLIVDGTEIKTDGSSDPDQGQATSSYYENSPTMNVLIGGTPGGLISYFSPAYSGSTSDRQIIERSDLFKKCQAGDTILADEGFSVQDLFEPYDVKIATPTPAVTGSLPHQTVMKDRKLSKRRVHVKRFIGLLKTFTILSKKLNHYYAHLTSEIVGVCVMLTNFKENSMK